MGSMGYMAFHIALFYLLIAQTVMKNEDRRFEFPADYMRRNNIPVHGRTLRSAQSSGRLAKFFLFSPKDIQTSTTLDVQNRQSLSNFNPALGTKIIIHGFLDSVAIAPWMHDMKDELLTYGDYNVIVVDWSSGNSIPYARAAANTERVGQDISELLKIFIEDYGAKPETFHLIGHSMGSHIAGFVGENIKGIGRISGLDPAGPRFEDQDLSKRLDPSDALFVDAIHTDSGGIGMVQATAHQDFYPNGGSDQPGCTASNALRALVQEGVIEGVRNLICSHMRAVFLFTASINNRNCDMTGIRCNSWEEFKDEKCVGCGTSGETCAMMGFHAEKQSSGNNKFQTYYLMTTPNEPYCAYEYLITFEVERNGNSRGGLLGLRLTDLPVIGDKTLKLTVHGSKGTAEFDLDDDRFDKDLNLVTYVVPSKTYLGEIDTAVIEWKQRKTARVLTAVTGKKVTTPLIKKIEIAPLKGPFDNSHAESYALCSQAIATGIDEKSTFRTSSC